MTASGWIVMLVVMGTVWGGFVLIVTTALRQERSGQDEPPV